MSPEPPEGFYFGEKRYLSDINYLPILAFNAWKNFVDGKGLICSEIFKRTDVYIPCPLKTLVFGEDSLLSILYRRIKHVEYTTPLPIQTLVYKFELWNLFKGMFKLFDAIRFLNDKNDRIWNSFAELTRGVFGSVPFCGIYLIEGRKICFIYTDNCENLNLEDFSHFS